MPQSRLLECDWFYTFNDILSSRVRLSRLYQLPRIVKPVESVGFLLIPGFALMSYAGAVEPLRAANQLTGKTLYKWWNAAPGDKPALASNGTAVVPDFTFAGDVGSLDWMLVCAGGNPSTFNDRRTFTWLRKLARQGITLGGVSGGPFILAKAGLLSGRRCTVHWEHLPALQEAFPDTRPTHSLFELDGDRVTCSGGVAGLDMMIALITRDHGYELATAVSDWLLHTHIRKGDRAQRMDLRFRWGVTDAKLLKVLTTMEANIESPLTRSALADLAGVSLRQLERVFESELGRGVHEHYLSLRLSRSRQLLRETSLSILEVSLATGFTSASQFSRAFRRSFALAPREARLRDRHTLDQHR